MRSISAHQGVDVGGHFGGGLCRFGSLAEVEIVAQRVDRLGERLRQIGMKQQHTCAMAFSEAESCCQCVLACVREVDGSDYKFVVLRFV